jgi:hypothetical protein
VTVMIVLVTALALAEAVSIVRLRASNRRLMDAVIDQTLDLAEAADELARLRTATEVWGT